MSERQRLPDRRESRLADFTQDGVHYRLHWSRFPDGRIGEVFLDAGRPGDPIDCMAKDAAVVLSMALQFGADPAAILAAMSQEADGTMRGPLGRALRIIRGEPEAFRAGTIARRA